MFKSLAVVGRLTRALAELRCPRKRRIFFILFSRQLFHVGVKSLPVIATIACLIGWVVLGNLFRYIPVTANPMDMFVKWYVTIVLQEGSVLLVGLVLISRSASAITTEIGAMHIFKQWEVLAAVRMSPQFVFVLPVLLAFPICFLLLWFYFNLLCLSVFTLLQVLYDSQTFDTMQLLQGLKMRWQGTSFLFLLINCAVSGIVIAMVSLITGSQVGERFTELSKALSRASSVQLVFFMAWLLLFAAWRYQ